VQVIGVEPEEREWVQGLKNSREFEKPGLYEERLLSERVLVPRQRAVETARLLAKREGLFVGESSGAAVSAAVAKARELKRGTLVVLLADGGERYLSSGLVE
jgi:cysteinyl-tRNA synthetase